MAHLLGRTAPALPAGYEQSSVAILAAMLAEVKLEFERAAARRVEENAALRRLFAEAAPVVADAALRERLEAAAASADPGLLVSELDEQCLDVGIGDAGQSHVVEVVSFLLSGQPNLECLER